jgi:hypothetical protein
MRAVLPIAATMCGAVLAQALAIACTQRSYSDYPSQGFDASHRDVSSSSSSGGWILDDAEAGNPLPDVFFPGDGPTGNCAVPSGKYTVTATPTSDSGAACTASTSTQTFPTAMTSDGGLSCTYVPAGSLPVCAIGFECAVTSGSSSTKITGSIQVVDTSLSGSEEVSITTYPSGQETICSYTLAYAKQ